MKKLVILIACIVALATFSKAQAYPVQIINLTEGVQVTVCNNENRTITCDIKAKGKWRGSNRSDSNSRRVRISPRNCESVVLYNNGYPFVSSSGSADCRI